MANQTNPMTALSNDNVFTSAVMVPTDDTAAYMQPTPVLIDPVTGAMSGSVIASISVAASTYTFDDTNIGKQIYFTFAGAVTVTIADSTDLTNGSFWMYACGSSTTINFAFASGDDSFVTGSSSSVASNDSGTIVLRTATKYENDPRLQSIPPAGDVNGPDSATDKAIAIFNGTSGTDIQNSGFTIDGATVTADEMILVTTSENITLQPGTGVINCSEAGLFNVANIGMSANLDFATAGAKITTATGANAAWNTTDAMTAGAVTVTNSSVTANSVITYARKLLGGTAGHVSITAQTDGSFTLTSSSGSETSTFYYQVVS